MCLLCAYTTRMVSGWPMSRGPAASGLAASEESTSTLQLDTKDGEPSSQQAAPALLLVHFA